MKYGLENVLKENRSALMAFLLFFELATLGSRAAALELVPNNPRYVFHQIDTDVDLSTRVISALAQDRDGFIWIGTLDGLFRFDGVNAQVFGEKDGLPSDYIEQLIVDNHGSIWVSTHGGIARFDGLKFVELKTGLDKEFFARKVTIPQRLTIDTRGKLYIATPNGLMQFDTNQRIKERIWTTRDGLPANEVNAVHAAADGTIWFAAGKRAGVLNPVTGRVNVLSSSQGVPVDDIFAILSNPEGRVWIRTMHNLLRREPGSRRFVYDDKGLPSRISDWVSLALDRKGNILVPTSLGLFYKLKDEWRRISENQGLVSHWVDIAFEDREGSLWIGATGAGLVRWAGRRSWAGWTTAEGLPNNGVWEVIRDNRDRLWLGTNDGVGIWDPTRHVWEIRRDSDGIVGKLIRNLASSSDGSVWALSPNNGITRFDPDTLAPKPFPLPSSYPEPLSMTQAPGGRIWISGIGWMLVVRIAEEGTVFEKIEVPEEISDNLRTIEIAPDGVAWTSGPKGISRFDGNSWRTFTSKDGLKFDFVDELAPLSGDEVWLSYHEQEGISQLLIEGKKICVRHIGKADGLPTDSIWMVARDGLDNIWAGGNAGVARISRDGSIRVFNRDDGLIWNDVSGNALLVEPDGSVFIGTSKGLAYYNPTGDESSTGPPNVVITSATLGDRQFLDLPGPEVEHDDGTFVVKFSGLTFRKTSDVRFHYRLVGLEEEFVETKKREVRYPSLRAGSYLFEVQCRSAAGILSEKAATFSFTVLSPWWETMWARTLAALMLLGIGASFYYIRVRQILKAKKRLEEIVQERTKTVVDQKEEIQNQAKELVTVNVRLRELDKTKSRFFANISHELRTPLTLILAPVEGMLSGELGEMAKEQLDHVRGIKRSALNLLKHINDLLDLSRLEDARLRINLFPFDLKSHLERILDFARPLAERKQIELFLDREEELVFEADEAKLERVFVNLISNALKFTDTGGQISVRVNKSNESVKITVTDTGIGIAKEDLKTIFDRFGQVDQSKVRQFGGSGIGLSLAKELVELHRGQLTVTSEPGQGSTFTVEIPNELKEIIPDNLIERRVEQENVPIRRRDQDKGISEWTNELLTSPEYRFMGINKVVEQQLAPNPQTVDLKSARLLVADDNPEILGYLQMSLENRYDIWTAQDGKEAWELLLAHRHDLVIADVMMPEMNGLELTHRIKKDPRTQDTPVILLTARDAAEHRVEGHAVGADQYVTKPFNPSELYAAIKSLLASRTRRIEVGARRRSTSLETLLGGMAHEMHNACHQVQNSQTAIYAIAKKLLKANTESKPESTGEIAGRLNQMEGICQRALERISKVVRSLEHYTRNQMQMPWKTIDLDDLVTTEVQLLTTAEEKGVTIKLSLESKAAVRGPKEEIRQMVLNLVENAIQAVEPGGLVEINTESHSGKARFSVSDNGCGIPADKKDQVFDPFFTTKDPGKGMGLGLALCKRTITDLGGEIEVRSKEGVGTQMLVSLPASSFGSTKPPPYPFFK
ncbi:MAG: response regulator [Proteobacteria bacterium]|nr:response regulator [Pseudomonadota bacterium]